MYNALKFNNSKFCLIGKINGLAMQSKRARKRLNQAAAKKNNKGVWRAAHRKTVIGIDTRHHLLAYAYLRGTPYHKVERACHVKPGANLILKIVQAHAPTFIPYDPKDHSGGKVYTVTLETVEQWLNEGN